MPKTHDHLTITNQVEQPLNGQNIGHCENSHITLKQENPIMKNTTLKARLIAFALLAVFALALLTPARQAQASSTALTFWDAIGPQVNWNSGGQ